MSRFILILIMSLFLVSCEETTAPLLTSTPFVDTTITLTIGEKVQVPGTSITLTMDSLLYDRRLPHGETASFWHNTAEINVAIEPDRRNLHLTISGEITDSGGIRFYGKPATIGDYQFQILQFSPLPASILVAPPDSELVAKIRISRATTPYHDDVGFFPSATGDRWIYYDTLFRDGISIAVRLDTVEIVGEYFDAFGHWGRFARWFRPFNYDVMARGDSMFSRQATELVGEIGWPQGFESMELIRPGADSIVYRALFEGDLMFERSVKAIDTSVVTEAGTFTGLYEYRADSPWWREWQILKPGIGFVFMQYGDDSPLAPTHQYSERLWLKEYIAGE